MNTTSTNPPKPDLGKGRKKPAASNGWISLKRGIAVTVATVLAVLILTATLPPLVADQSDRAVVNAPVTLLTAPIDGEVTSLAAVPGAQIGRNAHVAELINSRIDRSTLISLEGKETDTQENLRAIRAKKDSDAQYIGALGEEIGRQTTIIQNRYQEQTVELQAQVGVAGAAAEEKEAGIGSSGRHGGPRRLRA